MFHKLTKCGLGLSLLLRYRYIPKELATLNHFLLRIYVSIQIAAYTLYNYITFVIDQTDNYNMLLAAKIVSDCKLYLTVITSMQVSK